MGLVDYFKRKFARWEVIGGWHNDVWDLQGASERLLASLYNIERRNPSVWADAAIRGRKVIIHGEHFVYRITPLPSEAMSLLIERKPR